MTEPLYSIAAHEVETFSGQFVNTKNPRPETIRLEDIAHSLANTCRYGGHCKTFYSVAEHAVFVSIRLERQGFSRLVQLAGLHHDDAEAYLGDIPRPLKPLLGPGYRKLTDRMDTAVAYALNCGVAPGDFHADAVKTADTWALFVEARHLLPSQGKSWSTSPVSADWWKNDQPSRIITPDYWLGGVIPASAEDLYLARHRALTEEVA